MKNTDSILPPETANRRGRSFKHWAGAVLLAIFLVGMLWPEHPVIPVQGGTASYWNPRAFWAYPWGKSGVHKGIDIFAPKGRPVLAATPGVVLFTGRLSLGGNVICLLGPGWKVQYYAHLDSVDVFMGQPVCTGQTIGAVGQTGNAANTPPHLHFSLMTLIPYPWRIDDSPRGWLKMFYLDPGRWLGGST